MATLIEKIAAQIPGGSEFQHRGTTGLTFRSGNRVATVRPEEDGSVWVSAYIDYGDHGQTFCDARGFKQPAAAVRMIRKFTE